MITYNVSNTLLESAMNITPGKRSPTVTSLIDENFKSVSSLVKKGEAVQKMDELSELGATDILVFNLGNSRF